jgi:DNA-binding CsgD family transcriptional regulator/intracellular sulfur oxidation DsrE/DsrF family protein
MHGIGTMKTNQSVSDVACAPCEFHYPLAKTVLNSLSAHIAIIDEHGTIIETNRAWQEFAKQYGIEGATSFIGTNYLEICEKDNDDLADDAHVVADGIRSVIHGNTDEFLYGYPCHSPERQHWFYMRAIRMDADAPIRVIISHEEITALKEAEEALRNKKQALESQKQELEETNIALKVLLRQREADKLELEKKVLANIKELVFPYLEKLKRAPLRGRDKEIVNIIQSHLKEIISPLLQRLSNLNIILTPQEMQISVLIKDGKSSKEVADILNISETTVHFHRKNLRAKFGLKNRSANLRSYLISIS